jgi:lipopolysaccharide export system ATP-binding protein
MTTLKLTDLVKSYTGRRVVKSVSLEVKSGEVVGLLGPNGAGKTTTFYMTIGLVRPDEGKITLDGEEITDSPMYQRARKGVGYLPQETSIFRKLTVKQNIMAILEILPLSGSEREHRAEMLLEELGIKHLEKQKANVLSGGEKRRLFRGRKAPP